VTPWPIVIACRLDVTPATCGGMLASNLVGLTQLAKLQNRRCLFVHLLFRQGGNEDPSCGVECALDATFTTETMRSRLVLTPKYTANLVAKGANWLPQRCGVKASTFL